MELNFIELELAMGQLRHEMKKMEAKLREVPLDTLLLGMHLEWAESAWSEVIKFYNRLKVLTQDEQAKVEPIASGELQALYEDLHDRVERALDDHYLDVKAIKQSQASIYPVWSEVFDRVIARMEAAEVAEPPAAMDKARKPQEPVAKKVVKDSATGESVGKKKTTKSVMKPLPDKEREKGNE